MAEYDRLMKEFADKEAARDKLKVALQDLYA
jgi:hypothetical protein